MILAKKNLDVEGRARILHRGIRLRFGDCPSRLSFVTYLFSESYPHSSMRLVQKNVDNFVREHVRHTF